MGVSAWSYRYYIVSHDLMMAEQAARCRLFGPRAPDYFHAPLGMNVMRAPILPSEVLQ